MAEMFVCFFKGEGGKKQKVVPFFVVGEWGWGWGGEGQNINLSQPAKVKTNEPLCVMPMLNLTGI